MVLASERREDGFIDDHCVRSGLKLPAYLIVRLYTYGDINTSYLLIIANTHVELILRPNKDLSVFSVRCLKNLLCEIHPCLQQATVADTQCLHVKKDEEIKPQGSQVIGLRSQTSRWQSQDPN